MGSLKKTLTKEQFNLITSNISSIDIELEYDTNNGSYNNECYELFAKNYLLRININISTTGYKIPEDNYSPEEYVETSKNIDVTVNEVWEDEVEFEMTEKQNKELQKIIIENINY